MKDFIIKYISIIVIIILGMLYSIYKSGVDYSILYFSFGFGLLIPLLIVRYLFNIIRSIFKNEKLRYKEVALVVILSALQIIIYYTLLEEDMQFALMLYNIPTIVLFALYLLYTNSQIK